MQCKRPVIDPSVSPQVLFLFVCLFVFRLFIYLFIFIKIRLTPKYIYIYIYDISPFKLDVGMYLMYFIMKYIRFMFTFDVQYSICFRRGGGGVFTHSFIHSTRYIFFKDIKITVNQFPICHLRGYKSPNQSIHHILWFFNISDAI